MECSVENEILNISEQIATLAHPDKIILFGSRAKGTATKMSDIDLCVVSNTDDKRELLRRIYIETEAGMPFDVVLYTLAEWEEAEQETDSFAFQIKKQGIVLHG